MSDAVAHRVTFEISIIVCWQVGQKLLNEVRGHLLLPAGDTAADAAQLAKHGNSHSSMAGGGSRPGRAAMSAQLSGAKPAGTHVVFSGDDLADDFQASPPGWLNTHATCSEIPGALSGSM